MSRTEQIARRYFDAWTSGDSDTVTSLLAPDFQFQGLRRRLSRDEAGAAHEPQS